MPENSPSSFSSGTFTTVECQSSTNVHGEQIRAGRPFLVAQNQRCAEIRPTLTWLDEEIELPEVPNDLLLAWRLAEHWTDIALCQHAAIASFSRLTLLLMACKAPPALLRASALAQATKVQHARAAFQLASHYGHTCVGPGPLDVEDSILQADSERTLGLLIREGCLGETLAALEAEQAAAESDDPKLEAIWRRFAEDGGDHASFAWSTFTWLLESQPRLAKRTRAEFAEALMELPQLGRSDNDGIAGYGVLSSATRRDLQQRAIAGLLLPLSRAIGRGAAEELSAALRYIP